MKNFEMRKIINNSHLSNRRKTTKKLLNCKEFLGKEVNKNVEISIEEFCNALAASMSITELSNKSVTDVFTFLG